MSKKFIFNSHGLLSMNRDQIMQYHLSSIGEMRNNSIQTYRINQFEKYRLFLKRILGVNIKTNPIHDPFYKVTGFPIKKFAIDKWMTIPPDDTYCTCIDTDFISAEHLSFLGREENADPKSLYTSWFEDLAYTKPLEAYVFYDLISKINTSNSKNWFSYGLLNYQIFNEDHVRFFLKGIFFIQADILSKIKKNPNLKKYTQCSGKSQVG